MSQNIPPLRNEYIRKVGILNQAHQKAKLKQLNFKGGLTNIQSPRTVKAQDTELTFTLPIQKKQLSSRLEEASTTLNDCLASSPNKTIESLDCLMKKDRYCDLRKEYIQMVNWLKTSLERISHQQQQLSQESVYEYLHLIYGSCIEQIIEKDKKQSCQKALILRLVWDNLLELSKWLENYFKSKLQAEAREYKQKSQKEKQIYLETNTQLKQQISNLLKERAKKQQFFHEVVKDNRRLRRHNTKLLTRLRYEVEGNMYLKEENMKFYKENEKMKLVINQENQVKQLEQLQKKFMEIQKSLLDRKKVTKNSLLKEIQEETIKEKFEEEIRVIVKRLNQEDFLDLDYVQVPKVEELQTKFCNVITQTEKLGEDKAVNTYHAFRIPKKEEQEIQTTIPLFDIYGRIVDVCLNEEEAFQKTQKTITSQQSRMLKPPRESLFRDSSMFKTPRRSILMMDQRLSVVKTVDEPKTYEQRMYKLYNTYDGISKTIDNLRMQMESVPQHDKARTRREVKTIASKAFKEFKKLYQCSVLNVEVSPVGSRRATLGGDKIHQLLRRDTESLDNVGETSQHSSSSDRTKQVTAGSNRRIPQNKMKDTASSFRIRTELCSDPNKPRAPESDRDIRRGSTAKVDSFRKSYLGNVFSGPRSSRRHVEAQQARRGKLSADTNAFKEFMEQQLLDGISNHDNESVSSREESSKRTRLSKPSKKPSQVIERVIVQEVKNQISNEKPKRISQGLFQQFSITSNFASKDDVLEFFKKAACDEPIETVTDIQSGKIIVTKKEKTAKKLVNHDNRIKLQLNQLRSVPAQDIQNIIGRLEDALNSSQKELQTFLMRETDTFYSKTVMHRLNAFLFKEIYKQRNSLLKKDMAFEQFFRNWVIFRYGLRDLADVIIRKIRCSISKYQNEDSELAFLNRMFENSHSSSFSKGMFRILILFVEFGTETHEMTRGQRIRPCCPVDEMSSFLSQLLSVFLPYRETRQFLKEIERQSNKKVLTINMLEVYQQVELRLSSLSNNPQMKNVISIAFEDRRHPSSCQLTLDQLVKIWRLLAPQEEIETNVLKLIRFCEVSTSQGNQKLMIPVYKLTLLARRFGWQHLLYPIESVEQRFQNTYGEVPAYSDQKDWETEEFSLFSQLPQLSNIVQLLAIKMRRYFLNRKRAESEKFPMLLYKIVKLALADSVFEREGVECLTAQLNQLSNLNRQLNRKATLQQISSEISS